MKIFTLLIFFLGIIYNHQTHAQVRPSKDYKLFVNLTNAPFDSLYLHDYTEGRDVLIAGKKTKEFTWEITIPDSIAWDSENMELLASPNNAKSKSSRLIRFITQETGKSTILVNVGLENANNYIYASYLNKTSFLNQNISVKIGIKDSVIIGNLICEDFSLIIKDRNSDIAIRAQDPFYSWFMDFNGEKVSYENHLASYIMLSNKYPNSLFLLSNLANNLTNYKSKADVNKVYINFSAKHKNTIWAKNIERFLTDKKFQNTSLPTSHKNIYENIIQDSSKYNLVIFSASWCKPCMEEIPLLEKIYKDLGKHLILTYISIDKEENVNSFQKTIEEKGITWRTLFAYQNIKYFQHKYFVESIPHAILISPNQDMDVIDVRKYEDRSKLYDAVKSLSKNN